MKKKILVRKAFLAITASLVITQINGCAGVASVGTLVLEYPLTVVDISSYIGTGKSTTDHAISNAMRKDCKLINLITKRRICTDNEAEKPNIIKAKNIITVTDNRSTEFRDLASNNGKDNAKKTPLRVPNTANLDFKKNRGKQIVEKQWPPK